MTIKAPHSFSISEAIVKSKTLISKVLLEYKGQYSNFTESWRENVCDYQLRVKGQEISGKIKVDKNLVVVDISLPWTLFILKGKIKSEMESLLSQNLK